MSKVINFSFGFERFKNIGNTIISFVWDARLYQLAPGEAKPLPANTPQVKRLVEKGELKPLNEELTSWEDGLCPSCYHAVDISGSSYLKGDRGPWCSAFEQKLEGPVLECGKFRDKSKAYPGGIAFEISEKTLRTELQKRAQQERALSKSSKTSTHARR